MSFDRSSAFGMPRRFRGSSGFDRSSAFEDPPFPVLDFLARWRADYGISLNGPDVASWESFQGESIVMAQTDAAKQPTWNASVAAFGDHPTVQQDVDGYLRSLANVDLSGTNAVTMVIIGAVDADTGAWQAFIAHPYNSTNGPQILVRQNVTVAQFKFIGDVGLSQNTTFPGFDTSPHSWIAVGDQGLPSNEASLYRDGARASNQPSDANNNSVFSSALLQFFMRSATTFPARAQWTECFLWARGLTATERAALDALARARYHTP